MRVFVCVMVVLGTIGWLVGWVCGVVGYVLAVLWRSGRQAAKKAFNWLDRGVVKAMPWLTKR